VDNNREAMQAVLTGAAAILAADAAHGRDVTDDDDADSAASVDPDSLALVEGVLLFGGCCLCAHVSVCELASKEVPPQPL
jgi:hypothetical protein